MAQVASRTLHCNVPFDPMSFFPGLQGEIEQDERSLRLKEIDWNKVVFRDFLEDKDDDKEISVGTILNRQIVAGHIRFGGNVSQSLWDDYREDREGSVLEWLFADYKVTHVIIPGLVLHTLDGQQYVPYFDRHYMDQSFGEWTKRCIGLDVPWVPRLVTFALGE